MENSVTSLSIDSSRVVLLPWIEIDKRFEFIKVLSDNVFSTLDFAVKVIPSTDRTLSNELAVSKKLNLLSEENTTQVFSYSYGYILSMDFPSQLGEDLESQEDGYYVYLFMQPIEFGFADLPDEPKVNEDFYFEVLIALYYARKRFKFTHWDIHAKQLMFNKREESATRSYNIGGKFFVTIEDTKIQPKLIDYGKSALDETYSDDDWREPRFKKMWNKSDIYHLSLIFSHRENLSPKLRDFLDKIVLPMYRSSMYATQLERDSAANHKNIEELLWIYFHAKPE